MTLNQRRNRMLWDRMEEQDGETEEENEEISCTGLLKDSETCHKNRKNN